MSADNFPPIFEPDRFYRLAEILGNPNAKPPIKPRLPIPVSTWYELIKAGDIPPGTRLAPRVVAWHGATLNAVAARLANKYAHVRFGPAPRVPQRRVSDEHRASL